MYHTSRLILLWQVLVVDHWVLFSNEAEPIQYHVSALKYGKYNILHVLLCELQWDMAELEQAHGLKSVFAKPGAPWVASYWLV